MNMKNLKIFTLITASILVGLTACKKNDPKLTLTGTAKAPVLSINPSNIVLDSNLENSSEFAGKFTWTAPDYGVPIAATYTLEIAKSESDLGKTSDSAKVYPLTSSKEEGFKTITLNNFALKAGATPFEKTKFYARVLCSNPDNNKIPTLKSNIVSLDLTPYLKAIPPAPDSLRVAGDYQGWNPGAAPFILSKGKDGVYTGFVDIIKSGGPGTNEFKFTSQANWNGTNYGDGGTTGTLSTDGGAGNLKVPGEGTYKFDVNTNTLAWTYDLSNWGLIGSATPDGWNSDQNMQYDNANQRFSITINLVAGEIKFRKNDDWGTNFGDDGNDGTLEGGGANIPVGTDGNYTITLDTESKTYSITKN